MYLLYCISYVTEKFLQLRCISQERDMINVKSSLEKYISIKTHNEFQIRRTKTLFFELTSFDFTICKKIYI
jgi:hypothetical protein